VGTSCESRFTASSWLRTAFALSPSAIARQLRRLRSEGWIGRTIALVADRVTERRLRALVFIELAKHADHRGNAALEARLRSAEEIQFCYETTGDCDLLALIDCASMAEFNAFCDTVLVADRQSAATSRASSSARSSSHRSST
jgi:Lrp/AsnC family transcriptional regulator, leucine-responsive regulatory protein